jgi:hypothetical protein
MEYRRKVAEKLKPQLNEMIQASKRIQKEDEDDHFDVLPDYHHRLATWSLISPLWEDSSSIPPTLILIDWKSTFDTEHREITKRMNTQPQRLSRISSWLEILLPSTHHLHDPNEHLV